MISIRTETKTDYQAICQTTKNAFEKMAFSDGTEPELINNLREQGVLSVSLVATKGDAIVGHVAFSPAAITSGIGDWYALGPISVAPDFQGQGIGGSLIEAGINAITDLGAWGCILVGDPRYYCRHGFELAPACCPNNEPKTNFMLRLIGKNSPEGIFSFHPLFYQATE